MKNEDYKISVIIPTFNEEKNIEELIQIKEYYKNNFNLNTMFTSIVRFPEFLSIRNLPEKRKEELIDLYTPSYDDLDHGEIFYAIQELKNVGKLDNLKQLKGYLKKLSEHRNTDHTKLWPQYA